MRFLRYLCCVFAFSQIVLRECGTSETPSPEEYRNKFHPITIKEDNRSTTFSHYAYPDRYLDNNYEISGNETDSEPPIESEYYDDDDLNSTRSGRGNNLCGRQQANRIVGGNFTRISAYPWMIQIVTKPGAFPFCGGSIISHKFILTAAHCAVGSSPSTINVRVGHTSSDKKGKIVGVKSIIIHKRYVNIIRNDIALIELVDHLTFSNQIWPICIPTRENFQGTLGTIAGWGHVEEDGNSSDILKVADVRILEFKRCIIKSDYKSEDLHNRIVCGKWSKTDTCQGDSGGPLMYHDNVTFFQVGITSWGIGCARPKYPGIYTKVPLYRNWIMRKTPGAVYFPS